MSCTPVFCESDPDEKPVKKNVPSFHAFLAGFKGPSGEPILEEEIAGSHGVKQYTGEFWTSRQRQASSIQEISYRACFKPRLPRFFIDFLTQKGNFVYDPFSGRGTTAIEAGLLCRCVIANDANPLSQILSEPRFHPPSVEEVSFATCNHPTGW